MRPVAERDHRGQGTRRRGTRAGLVIVLITLIAACAVGGYQLGRRTLASIPRPPAEVSPVVVTTKSGTLLDQRTMSVEIDWPIEFSLTNRIPGTITASYLTPGTAATLKAGFRAYDVNEDPVVVLPGPVPAYRSIEFGSVGSDVLELQQYLGSLGYAISDADGRWAHDTTAAYQRWRRDQGLPPRNRVELGEVIFVPSLPVQVTAASALRPGALVADGDQVIDVLSNIPRVTLPLGADGSLHVQADTQVVVSIGDTPVEMKATGEDLVAETGTRRAQLVLATPGATCTWCSGIPTGQTTSWTATVTLAGPATGIVLPIAALRTAPDGSVAVTRDDGSTAPVQVVLEVGGDAVITGLEADERVRLPVVEG